MKSGGGGGGGKSHFRLVGTCHFGVKNRPKNLSESLEITPKNQSVYPNIDPKILISSKGLNLETVFLLLKKLLRTVSSRRRIETCYK